MKKSMCLMMMVSAMMTAPMAEAADRDTPERSGDFVQLTAGAAIPAGNMVGVWTNGLAYSASDTLAGQVILGRCEKAAASGASVLVKRGVFAWVNGAAFVAKDIGSTAYVGNGYTLTTAAIATNDIAAGKIYDCDTNVVWLKIGN